MAFQRRCHRGFTFIELIFIITLLAILAAVAVPQFRRSFDSLVLQNFVSDLTSLAMYAQAKAISGSAEASVDFDLPQKRVLTEDHLVFRDPYGVDVDQWVTGKVKSIPDSVLIDLKEGKAKIVFYPDGTSDRADFEIKGKYGGKYSVSVDPGTGYVNVKQTE
ncbi:MAG: prepilin-type N-terminal cleavage/methylation domain-containing protein [Candidatus Omnitrophica bacterium]|nr:prepilin-type N-terminal cleavage/methylation domain-containing protein [Candidatus Omnitrophota bacterium]MDD5310332.1 prepilin-type N-terminal cleavage/methylation domain-containing protein [Candidatus Omnitrophota bacterium]MDD5545877.1 prepilin-type N-terminal cleavage/methylation domain-containing protein [Candidatus Omnitrophota bacterium]